MEAIEGALKQDYKNLEIIISDDCSTDLTWRIIEKKCSEYNGKHKLILNRNPTNLGLASHVNKILNEVSSGDYVALAAGDDISLPRRISHSISFMEKHVDVVSLSTGTIRIDANSELLSKQPKRLQENRIYTIDYFLSNKYRHLNAVSRILTRDLINAYPPLNDLCPTEDTPTLLRAFMYGRVALLKENLVKRRLHGSNISSPENIRKMNLDYVFDQNFSDIDYAERQSYIGADIAIKFRSKINRIRFERKSGNRVIRLCIRILRKVGF